MRKKNNCGSKKDPGSSRAFGRKVLGKRPPMN